MIKEILFPVSAALLTCIATWFIANGANFSFEYASQIKQTGAESSPQRCGYLPEQPKIGDTLANSSKASCASSEIATGGGCGATNAPGEQSVEC